MYDVVALGEFLIDFTPAGISENGNVLFERNPGGAPANVLACLARFGKKTAFIGKVGNDQFGLFLKDVIKNLGVDERGLVFSDEVNTTLAFVHLNEQGDRSFSFYRNPGADMMLEKKDIRDDIINNTNIFHFGSVSMTCEPARSTTLHAVKKAKSGGSIISYDPNLRPPLWNNLQEARKIILEGFGYADIVKISEEELVFLTGQQSLEEGSQYLLQNFGTKLIFVTLGPQGCFYRMGEITGRKPTFDVKTVDTTGAGDAFMGGILYKVLEMNKALDTLTAEDIENMVRFANAVGSLATTSKGAIPAMPFLEQVKEILGI